MVTCEIKLFCNNFKIILAAERVLKLFQIISATLNMLKNIRELQWASEIILK